MRQLLILAALLPLLAGCGPSKRDKLTADLSASIFEAATAIERGVPPAKPCAAIKAAAAAVIYAHGHDYPPAADHLKTLAATAKETP